MATDPHKTFAHFPDLGWFFATPIPTPPFTCRICSTPAIQVRPCYPRLLHRNPAPPRYPRLQCPAPPPTHFPTRSTTHSDTPRYQHWCSRPSWSRTRSGRRRWCWSCSLGSGCSCAPSSSPFLGGFWGWGVGGRWWGGGGGCGGWFQFFQFFFWKARGLRSVRWWIGVKIGVDFWFQPRIFRGERRRRRREERWIIW